MATISLLSSGSCHVAVVNVGMLQFFAIAMAAAVIVSVLTGKTYFKRVILREEEPLNFWVTVAGFAFLAVFVVGMLYGCSHA